MLKTALVPLLVATLVSAQSPLTTTFAHDNNGAINGCVYFDLVVSAPGGITVTGIDLNLQGSGQVAVLTTPGTRLGVQTTTAPWTQVALGTVVGAVPGVPSPVAIPAFALAPGSYGVAVMTAGLAHYYTNGTGSNQNWANADLSLAAGEASHVPFTAPLFAPRVVNASIHYLVGGAAVVASNTVLGAGCYSRFTSFYEAFASAGSFDLANSALTLTPVSGGYSVARTGAWRPVGSVATPVALALGDDDEVTVPFTAGGFPGWTAMTVCSNGFVSRAVGNGLGLQPLAATMLAAPVDAFWSQHDYDPTAGGAIKVEQGAAVTVVTWDGVWDYGGTSPANANSLQLQLHGNGVVTFAWGAMSGSGNGHLVGYSPGGASNDPGSRDLSALGAGTFALAAADELPLVLAATSRPRLGTSWSLTVGNVPVTAQLGVRVFGTGDPGLLDLSAIGAPGCGLRATLDLVDAWVITGSSHAYALAIPNAAALLSLHVFTTAAVFTSPPANAFGAITANGIDGRLGNL